MSRTPAILRTGVLVLALAGALTLVTTSAASAHDGLVSSTPAADSTVTTAVESVSLEFSENFFEVGTTASAFAVQVQGPDDAFYNLGCVTLDGATISTDAALGESGQYTVLWQVVSSDGHPTSDTFTFDYQKPADAAAATGAASGDTCSDGAAAPPAERAAAGPPVGLIVAIAVALVLAGAVAASVLVRRGKRARA